MIIDVIIMIHSDATLIDCFIFEAIKTGYVCHFGVLFNYRVLYII